MEDFGYGEYIPIDIEHLPPLYLVYAENPSDSGKVICILVKSQFLSNALEM